MINNNVYTGYIGCGNNDNGTFAIQYHMTWRFVIVFPLVVAARESNIYSKRGTT